MSWTPIRRARMWLAALLTIAMCSFVSVNAVADGPKIAVIDLNRAIADTEDGIRVKAQLQELVDARQVEYQLKEKALAEAKSEYDQLVEAGKTKQPALRKKLVVLEKMAYELQVAQYSYRREMQQKEYQLMQPIIRQMLQLVRRLASKQGYEMVLNKEAVPFFRSDLDITDRVVQMYNTAQAATPKPKKDAKPGSKTAPKATPKKKPGKAGGARRSRGSKASSKSTSKKKSSKKRSSKSSKKRSSKSSKK